MKHSSFVRSLKLPGGHFPTNCPGPLVHLGEVIDRASAAGLADRLITVYQCLDCQARISTDGAVILNEYFLPKPVKRTSRC